jgi:hypothetical protein
VATSGIEAVADNAAIHLSLGVTPDRCSEMLDSRAMVTGKPTMSRCTASSTAATKLDPAAKRESNDDSHEEVPR